MYSLIIFAVCVGLSSQQLPSHSDLKQMIAQAFNYLDTNGDGILSVEEMNSVVSQEDADGDGFVTLDEYIAFTNFSQAVAQPMFAAFDTDNTGKLPTNYMSYYLHLMDNNGDGQVNYHEYEHYSFKLYNCVYSSHGHTHGHAETCIIQ